MVLNQHDLSHHFQKLHHEYLNLDKPTYPETARLLAGEIQRLKKYLDQPEVQPGAPRSASTVLQSRIIDPAAAAPAESEIHSNQLTFLSWLRLSWGFFWRELCIYLLLLIGILISGFIIGLKIGLIAMLLQIPSEQIENIVQFVSFFIVIGAIFFIQVIFIKWILHTKFGPFRFRLFITDPPSASRDQ